MPKFESLIAKSVGIIDIDPCATPKKFIEKSEQYLFKIVRNKLFGKSGILCKDCTLIGKRDCQACLQVNLKIPKKSVVAKAVKTRYELRFAKKNLFKIEHELCKNCMNRDKTNWCIVCRSLKGGITREVLGQLPMYERDIDPSNKNK